MAFAAVGLSVMVAEGVDSREGEGECEGEGDGLLGRVCRWLRDLRVLLTGDLPPLALAPLLLASVPLAWREAMERTVGEGWRRGAKIMDLPTA